MYCRCLVPEPDEHAGVCSHVCPFSLSDSEAPIVRLTVFCRFTVVSKSQVRRPHCQVHFIIFPLPRVVSKSRAWGMVTSVTICQSPCSGDKRLNARRGRWAACFLLSPHGPSPLVLIHALRSPCCISRLLRASCSLSVVCFGGWGSLGKQSINRWGQMGSWLEPASVPYVGSTPSQGQELLQYLL